MNNLRGLYFDEYALSFLTQFVLALVMLFYLLRLTADIRRVWAIVLFFVAMALYAGVELVVATGHIHSHPSFVRLYGHEYLSMEPVKSSGQSCR